MKKINLFKKSWNKAFRSGESPEKLADDLDFNLLKGYCQIKEYNPFTGQIISISEKHNTLVNQARSNLIRLISQGQSNWLGQITPTQLKISKMRFCNNDPGGSTPSKLLYYKLTEPSSKGCTPVSGDVNPGGNPNTPINPDPLASVTFETLATNGLLIAGTTTNLRIFTVSLANGSPLVDNPPSHGTFKIELLRGGSIVETLYFYNTDNPSNIMVYTRQLKNPYKVTTVGVDPTTRVVAPLDRSVVEGSNRSHLFTSADSAKTGLFYDYSDGVWKLQLEELQSTSIRYDTVRMVYERGKFNIINSVVPRDGYNVGTGASLALRYSGNTAGDYYPTLSSIEYRDGDTDFVDDYSATFSVNMAGHYGNGVITTIDKFIKYKCAYLFNERDDMFSALYLTTTFDKNPFNAFYISWTLLAPLS